MGTCLICNMRGKKNQQSLVCDKCALLFHRTCLKMKSAKYNECTKEIWNCHSCTTQTEKPICTICKRSKGLINLKCVKCKDTYHKVCVKKAYPSHRQTDFMWTCPGCHNTPTLMEKAQKGVSLLKGRGIRIGHVNIRDLTSSNKKDDVTDLIEQSDFHVFGISETWLYKDINDSEFHIDGFQIFRNDRPNISKHNRGGGVLLYVKDEYIVTQHAIQNFNKVDAIHVTLKKPEMKPLHLILMYKSPTASSNNLLQCIDRLIKSCESEEAYFLGDFNCNMLKQNSQTREFIQRMKDANFEQIIKNPIRVTSSSSTLIDCIFTNKPELNQSGVIRSSLADHDLIYTIRKKPKTKKSPPKCIEIRSFKNINYANIKKMLESAPWWILEHSKDVEAKYLMFQTI